MTKRWFTSYRHHREPFHIASERFDLSFDSSLKCVKTAPLSMVLVLSSNTESRDPMDCLYIENHSKTEKGPGVHGLNKV